MDYRKIYDDLINKAKSREVPEGYSERHHIVPRSLGGSDASENLVNLTAREHFIAHALLVKFTTGKEKAKMYSALWAMCNFNSKVRYQANSTLYEIVRKENSKRASETMKGTSHALGFKHSKEECERRRTSMKGNTYGEGKRSPEVGRNISKSKTGKKRGEFSEEWKTNLKLSRRYNNQKYLITSPDGITFIWLTGLGSFCEEFSLTHSRVKKYIGKVIPVSEPKRKTYSQNSRNADGWKVEIYGSN